jgi:hypothetical protein
VLKKSKDLLAEKYPGIEFHVIYYNGINDPLSKNALNELRKNGIMAFGKVLSQTVKHIC